MIDKDITVFTKVNLADIFYVTDKEELWTHHNKISRKHVDFLLCNQQTIRPLVAIELDDSSHKRVEREERDRFLEEVYSAAGLPLVHIKVQSFYRANELRGLLESHLHPSRDTQKELKDKANRTPECTDEGVPICAKCGTPMVLRIAHRGENRGNEFWGCANFPKCRVTAKYIKPNHERKCA